MISWRDPGKGPSKPNALNLLISSRREIGVSLDTGNRLRRDHDRGPADGWDAPAGSQPEGDPIF